ncbi:hypothetical protein J6590_009654 [Homalodisca vitripennis]|nr:hypothetical protein J6590_009654 [Homalodisca vitripennis]
MHLARKALLDGLSRVRYSNPRRYLHEQLNSSNVQGIRILLKSDAFADLTLAICSHIRLRR